MTEHPMTVDWDVVVNQIRAVTRMLENRRHVPAPLPVRLSLEVLDVEIGIWRWSMPCELTVICRAHRRKCSLETAGDLGRARVKHQPKVGEPEELCFSQRFLVRREFDYGREVMLDELPGEFARAVS